MWWSFPSPWLAEVNSSTHMVHLFHEWNFPDSVHWYWYRWVARIVQPMMLMTCYYYSEDFSRRRRRPTSQEENVRRLHWTTEPSPPSSRCSRRMRSEIAFDVAKTFGRLDRGSDSWSSVPLVFYVSLLGLRQPAVDAAIRSRLPSPSCTDHRVIGKVRGGGNGRHGTRCPGFEEDMGLLPLDGGCARDSRSWWSHAQHWR